MVEVSDEGHPGGSVFRWLLGTRVVAATLLVLALAELPYGYYQMLRWVICAVAAFTAFVAYSYGREGWTVVFGAVAVLFNPIAPFYLSREIWAVLDVATAVVFLVSFVPLRQAKLFKQSR